MMERDRDWIPTQAESVNSPRGTGSDLPSCSAMVPLTAHLTEAARSEPASEISGPVSGFTVAGASVERQEDVWRPWGPWGCLLGPVTASQPAWAGGGSQGARAGKFPSLLLWPEEGSRQGTEKCGGSGATEPLLTPREQMLAAPRASPPLLGLEAVSLGRSLMQCLGDRQAASAAVGGRRPLTWLVMSEGMGEGGLE